MLKHFFDTIIAPITGTQKAAVSVLRLSGPRSFEITGQLFKPWPANENEIEPRKLIYGQFIHEDDGFAVYFKQGESYTGEASVELSIHGSPASVKTLLNEACKVGARLAQPGEFTQRAFLNGRIDLTKAEGVRATIDAQTDSQFKAATQLREGALGKKVALLRNEVVSLLATIEAHVDFSEEIGDLDRTAVIETTHLIIAQMDDLLKHSQSSRILREGLRIALVGLPNAGKSSLFNALLGLDRAIVTEIPGTTRDTVEEPADLGGVPCFLIDTAGLRETDDRVEQIGVERTKVAANQADWIWYIYDAHLGWTKEDDIEFSNLDQSPLIIANKVDLKESEKVRGLGFSAKSLQGLDRLIHEVRTKADMHEGQQQLCLQARHESLLLDAKESLEHVVETLSHGMPEDLASVGLAQAAQSLGEITGETATEDMIDRIFHDFCIGK